MHCDGFHSPNLHYAAVGPDRWSSDDPFMGGKFLYDPTMDLRLPEDLYDVGWDGQPLLVAFFPSANMPPSAREPSPPPRSSEAAGFQATDPQRREWQNSHHHPQVAPSSSSWSQPPGPTRAPPSHHSICSYTGSTFSVDDSVSAASSVSSTLPPRSARAKRSRGRDGEAGLALRCPHKSCNSTVVFRRQCDLDKHYRLHFRHYFCRVEGCPQADSKTAPGYATAKDRRRHETSHNPSLTCEYCDRVFSRLDNLRDHCRRLHKDV